MQSLLSLFQSVQDDAANNVRFDIDPDSIVDGQQTVTITGVREKAFSFGKDNSKGDRFNKPMLSAVFSIVTSGGVPVDSAFTITFDPEKVSVLARNKLGFISEACGISPAAGFSPESFKGAAATVRLTKKTLSEGGSCWVISNWAKPLPGGSFKWMWTPAREAAEVNGNSEGKKRARNAHPDSAGQDTAAEVPAEAVPEGPTDSGGVGNLDEVLGTPDSAPASETADSSKPKRRQTHSELLESVL
jgi:hypothetical protein